VPRGIDWSGRYPRPLLDKLGVKKGARVTLLALDDAAFGRRLAERTPDISARTRQKSDLIFFGVRSRADLGRLAALRKTLNPGGAIWVVRVKGEAAAVKETDVITAAKAAALVDIKVVSFSESQSALKLVIPVAWR
jgi:hypothetical protein